MIDSWRLLNLGVTDPYDGEPIMEMLLTALKRDLIPNTLCFYVPRRYVWVGVRTNLETRVNLEYCRKEKIPIVRGMLAGGAALHNGDTLLCVLVSRGKPTPNDFRLAENYTNKGLQYIGLEATQRPGSNDILVKGRKVSGTGNTILPGGGFLSAGDLVLDFNYELCEKVLLPVPELFADKEAKSHREWVTTLKRELGREVSFDELKTALVQGFKDTLQIEFEATNLLTESEAQLLEGLREKYHSETWMKYGKWSPVKDYWRPE